MLTAIEGTFWSGTRGLHRARKGSAANHEIIFRKRRRPGIRKASADPRLLRLDWPRQSLHPSWFVVRPSGRE